MIVPKHHFSMPLSRSRKCLGEGLVTESEGSGFSFFRRAKALTHDAVGNLGTVGLALIKP